jgi:ribose transport system permease protein
MTDEMVAETPTVPGLPADDEMPRRGLLGTARGSTAFWIGLFIIFIAIAFGVASTIAHGSPVYLKVDNLLSIGLNASQVMLLAVGMTFLIGAGHLDLSVGYALILSSVVAAKVMVAVGGTAEEVAAGQYPNLALAILLGIVTAIVVGALIGLVNGLLVTRLRLSSFIVTLATSGIAYGIALVAAAVLWYVLRRTRFGLWTLAIGSSREAAIRSGVPVNLHTVKLFVLMGVLVGIAAVVDIARNANTNVVGHQTDNLQAIAAVVLGGTSLFGGIASIGGSILGTLVPVMLQNGLVIMQVQPFYQFVIVGVILILAVYFDQRRRERAT